jgi:hypothetical protein
MQLRIEQAVLAYVQGLGYEVYDSEVQTHCVSLGERWICNMYVNESELVIWPCRVTIGLYRVPTGPPIRIPIAQPNSLCMTQDILNSLAEQA